jgi:hypothetical protein
MNIKYAIPANVAAIQGNAFDRTMELCKAKKDKTAEYAVAYAVYDAAAKVANHAEKLNSLSDSILRRVTEAKEVAAGLRHGNSCGVLQGFAGEMESANALFCASVERLEMMCRLAGCELAE